MNTRNVRATLVLAAVLVAAPGCSSGGSGASPAATSAGGPSATASMPMGSGSAPGTAAPGSATAGPSAITIKDFAYGTPLVVAAGTPVTITNMDSAEHTVTADDGAAFDVDVKGSGGTASFTAPSKPGTYTYHCTFHPGMHGTLTVQ